MGEEDAIQHLLEVGLSHAVGIISSEHIKKTDCRLRLQENAYLEFLAALDIRSSSQTLLSSTQCA